MEKSFKPIVGKTPKVLILGTLPGKESLRLQQYYGHPRNIFWKLMYQLFKENFQENYKERELFLKRNNIALWDVCFSADRKSSLDVDIKNEFPNSINKLIEENPSIKMVGFNGKKTEKLYDKYFIRYNHIKYYTLLSTSPANASFSFIQKLTQWRVILNT